MKAGDLIRVKDFAAYGNAYMQSISGHLGIVVEVLSVPRHYDRAVVLLCDSVQITTLQTRNIEVINESR